MFRRKMIKAAALVALLFPLAVVGCSARPQFPAEDQRLLEGLRTAISAHNAQWLAASVKQIEDRHKQGKMSDEQYEALQQVIEATKRNDFKAATDLIIRLENAQRPS